MKYFNIAHDGYLGCYSGFDEYDAVRSYFRTNGESDRVVDIARYLGVEPNESAIRNALTFVETTRDFFDEWRCISRYIVDPMSIDDASNFDWNRYFALYRYEFPGVDMTAGERSYYVKDNAGSYGPYQAHDEFEAAVMHYGKTRAEVCAETNIDPSDDAAYRAKVLQHVTVYERKAA